MKYLKLKLTNFKPYYGNDIEIILFDKNRPDKPITICVGYNEYGKTSISEALKWCLYGESLYPKWEEWINNYAIKCAEEGRKKEVKMAVKLEVKTNGEVYEIIRWGRYDVNKKEKICVDEYKISNTLLEVKKDGGLIKDPVGFVNKNFLRMNLIDYFIFDADALLETFERDPHRAIKDHINKIVGVKTLDDTINVLGKVVELYENDIDMVQERITGEAATKIRDYKKSIKIKEDVIKDLRKDINKKTEEKNKLFSGKKPPEQVKRFTGLVKHRDALQEEIKKLNESFKNENLIPKIYLLSLSEIIKESLQKLKKTPPSKENFAAAIEIIKAPLGKNHTGLFFEGKEKTSLLKSTVEIDKDDLASINELNFGGGIEIKVQVTEELRHSQREGEKISGSFHNYKKEIGEKIGDLVATRNKIEQIGNTEKNKKLRKDFMLFRQLEGDIEDKLGTIEGLEKAKDEIRGDLDSWIEKQKIEKEDREKLQLLRNTVKEVGTLINIVKETKKKFLDELLSELNKKASEFLRKTVDDTYRFHSMEVDSDYDLHIFQKNGRELEKSQINKATMQIALMAFYSGLSRSGGMPHEIPYIMDNPLMRLDPRHANKVINNLAEGREQIIMHLLPGREYVSDTFNWLKPFINTQEWIARSGIPTDPLLRRSYIEHKDPALRIAY